MRRFFDRLFGRPRDHQAGATLAARLLPRTGRGYFLAVVGESHYQHALTTLRDSLAPARECSVLLAAEPENPHDPNAVVVKSLAGRTLGYLSRTNAPRYQPLLQQLAATGHPAAAAALLTGGTPLKPSIGIVLDVEDATILVFDRRTGCVQLA